MAKAKKRVPEHLAREDWIEAALTLLAVGGIDAVRVEELARQLRVTKGSFYWHFKDRRALCTAMLDSWRDATVSRVWKFDEAVRDPREALKRLLQAPFAVDHSGRDAGISLSLRLWARYDRHAQNTVAEIDTLRRNHIADLLIRTGMRRSDARARSMLIYAYMREAGMLMDRSDLSLKRRCEALLLG